MLAPLVMRQGMLKDVQLRLPPLRLIMLPLSSYVNDWPLVVLCTWCGGLLGSYSYVPSPVFVLMFPISS